MHAGTGLQDMAETDQRVRCWQDAVELAQVELAEALARSIGRGHFDRARYQDWLAMESAACRIDALSLDAVAGWHGTQPGLQATAKAWSVELRDLAATAAYDVRVLDGMAGAPPPALGKWHAFVGAAAGSQRAGEVLGALLLHTQLLDGPMRAVAATVSGLPFSAGSRYLPQRLRTAGALTDDRAALLDAYSTTALAVGAQRASGWYRAAMADVLRPGRE